MTSHMIVIAVVTLLQFSVSFAVFCEEDEHECSYSSKCINSEYLCDGDNDCGDWTDESVEVCNWGISNDPPTTAKDKEPCTFPNFQCISRDKCISPNWLCDGEDDCDDGEDEEAVNCHHAIHDRRPIVFGSNGNSAGISTDVTSHPEETTQQTLWWWGINRKTPSTQSVYNNIYTTPGRREWPFRSSAEFSTQRFRAILPTTPRHSWPIPYTRFYNHDETESSGDYDETLGVESFGWSSTTSPKPTINDKRPATIATTTDFPSKTKIQVAATTENCDPESSSILSAVSWMEISLAALSLVIIIIIIAFICRRRRMHVAILNPKREEPRQVVSYISSPTSPECQVVLVGNAVSVQPAILQSATCGQYMGSPPPYNTQPASTAAEPTESKMQDFVKNEESAV